MSDLVGNPEDRFSHVAALIMRDKSIADINRKAQSNGTSSNGTTDQKILAIRNYVYIEVLELGFCPRPLGPKEIDELLVPTGKASLLLTDHLMTV